MGATPTPNPDEEHSADVERATRNSLSDAGPGAFRIPGPDADDAADAADGPGPPPRQAPPPRYTADNLPPNIDIVAEATLVSDGQDNGEDDDESDESRSRDTFGLEWDDRPGLGGVAPDSALSVGGVSRITQPHVDPPNKGAAPVHPGPALGGAVPGAASAAVSAITEADMRLPSAVMSLPDAEVRRYRVAQGQRGLDGTRNAALSSGTSGGGAAGEGDDTAPTAPETARSAPTVVPGAGDDGGAPETSPATPETPPAAVARATKMDNSTVYAFGGTYSVWKVAAVAAACLVAVVVPLAVLLPKRGTDPGADEANEAAPPPRTHDWTRDEVLAAVTRTLPSPGLLDESDSPQARAVEWLVGGGGARHVVPDGGDGPAAGVGDGPGGGAGLSAEARIVQRYVLAVLYYSTSGDTEWTSQYNYLSDEIPDECDWGVELNNGWKSIDCDDLGNVQLINLWTNNLVGTIPDELAELGELTTIDLLTNSLSGTLPSRLAEMTQLRYLNLGYNRLTGTLSPDLGNLDRLQYFMVDINRLTGTIPSELSRLGANLTGWLSVEGNDLTGTVPRTFDSFVNATWLYFNRNRLDGSVEFMCDRLRPEMAPGGGNADAGLPLLELWADRDRVECSCCNCCPFPEEE